LLSEKVEPVIPDLIVRLKDDTVLLELNREWFPRLRLYNPYEEKLELVKDPEVREFMRKNMNAARDLIDGLKRREETMCRVADFILHFQKDHLEEGITHVKTLTITDIAQALELHPSTISRTIAEKYIQINNKTIALKQLLSHGIKNGNGEVTSKAFIKNRIKKLIDEEDKAKPLSDSALKERLKQEGISIQRRTVAKYREALRILPTHLRRKRQ
jgi:RNA polymerase sigma-54 factor